MLADLLTPATADLLEGWTGPVVADGAEEVWTRGRLLIVDEDDEAMWWGEDVDHGDVFLDLSRAECRDRVARCLAKRHGLVTEDGLLWGRDTDEPARWDLRGWHRLRVFRPVAVPALAALDPSDDTHLPDGSRRVDALALRLCWEASRG